MIEYSFFNTPHPKTGEIADMTFHEERFERLLGSLVIADESQDYTLEVLTFPSHHIQALKETGERMVRVNTRLGAIVRKVGLRPPEVQMPDESDMYLKLERAEPRKSNCLFVRLDHQYDEHSNQVLALQTYLWAAEANGLPSSQRWRNRLQWTPDIASVLGGAGIGLGISEIPMPISWFYGIAGGAFACQGIYRFTRKLAASGDADFDRAVEFAKDYTTHNEPIIETNGPPYIPGDL